MIHEFGGYGVGQISQKNRVASAIGPVFVDTHGCPHQKIIHLLRINLASFEHFRKQLGQQVIGPYLTENVSGGIGGS